MTKWITVKTFAPHVEMTKDQIYRLIREAEASPEKREEIFPFRFVRLGRQIRIDAASAGGGQRFKIVKRKRKTKS